MALRLHFAQLEREPTYSSIGPFVTQMSHSFLPRALEARLFLALTAGNLLLALLHVVFVHAFPEIGSVRRLVDMGLEANPPAWYNGTLLMLIALSCLLIGLQLREENLSSPWRLYVLATLGFTFLSVDEVGMVHETINGILFRRIGAESGFLAERRFVGLITFAMYALVATALLAWRRNDVRVAATDPRGRRWIFGGTAFLLAGAVALDAIEELPSFTIWLEELCELTGTSMILCGCLARLQPRIRLTLTHPDLTPPPPKVPASLNHGVPIGVTIEAGGAAEYRLA